MTSFVGSADKVMATPLDDSQVLRLAADPRMHLFPPLRGSTVIGPLVLLAGLLPCLTGLPGGEFGDRSAGWALRALDVIYAGQIQDWLEPGRNGLGSGFRYQPPLSAWFRAVSIPAMGTDDLGSWHYLTLGLVCLMIWSMYLLARRVGGTSFGLLATLVICCHPILLRLGTGSNPTPLGILLIIIAVWGFLGHLEGPPQLVSMRMLAGSLAWGLALLTVGPVALSLAIPMFVHVWLLRDGRHDTIKRTLLGWIQQIWLGTRSLVVFMVTALSFSGWWQLMMLTNYGSDFWNCWWTGHVTMNFPPENPRTFWPVWLGQNVFLCGWLAAGLFSVLHELKSPTSELVRRRCQFVLMWWLTALSIRIVFDIPALRRSAIIEAWDVMLLLPTALLSAWGAQALIRRQLPTSIEALLLVSTMGLITWRVSGSIGMGVAASVVGLVLIALVPIFAPRFRRGARRWSERDWKYLFRSAFAVVLIGHLSIGFIGNPPPTPDSQSLSEVRRRIARVSEVPTVTLMSLNGLLPESLMFVVRSRWPESEFVVAGEPDGKPPRDTSATAEELVIEWTQYELRLENELPSNRQAIAVGDPLRFRGRRLMIYRVGPRQM